MADKPTHLKLLDDIPQKETRQKTGQDSKRWRKMLGLLKSGVATLTIAGSTLTRDEVRLGLNTVLDEMIDDDYREYKKIQMKKRRRTPKK